MMDNNVKTTFKISTSIEEMRNQAAKIAQEEGLTDKHDIDAFRHAYVSAKIQEEARRLVSHKLVPGVVSDKIAEASAYIAGSAVEWGREFKDRKKSWLTQGNPKTEWAQDMDNNADGRGMEQVLEDMHLSPAEKERRLRSQVAQAVRDGTLQTHPSTTNQRYYPDEQSAGQASIMESMAGKGGAVKVKSYTKDDGTKVKAHKRSWPMNNE